MQIVFHGILQARQSLIARKRLYVQGYTVPPTQTEIGTLRAAAQRFLIIEKGLLIFAGVIAYVAGSASIIFCIDYLGLGIVACVVSFLLVTFGVIALICSTIISAFEPARELLGKNYFDPLQEPTLYQRINTMSQKIPVIREWCITVGQQGRELTHGELRYINELWSQYELNKNPKENAEQLQKAMASTLSIN